MHPDDAAHNDKGHRREEHQTAVRVEPALGHVPALRDDAVAQQRARTQQFAEERHDHQDQAVAQAVADAVQQRGPRLVGQRKGFDAAHDDAVRDNQTYIDRQLFRHFVDIGLEHLVHKDYQRGDDHQLDDDADAGRHAVAQQRHDEVRERRHDRHRQRHDDGRFELHRHGQRRADAQYLYDYRVVRREGPGQVFEILATHGLPYFLR